MPHLDNAATGGLQYRPVLDLPLPRPRAVHAFAGGVASPEPDGAALMRDLLRLPARVPETVRIVVDAMLLDRAGPAAIAACAALGPRVAVVFDAADSGFKGLPSHAEWWRARGASAVLAGFAARPEEIACLLTQTFDEVWLGAALTRRLPMAKTRARGLLRDLTGLLQRRGVSVVADGVAAPTELSGAIDLGLAGACGPLFGDGAEDLGESLRHVPVEA